MLVKRYSDRKCSMTRSVIQAWNAQSRECQCKLLNGVMVALQILVLSVWVRVLVEQLNERLSSIIAVFFYLVKEKVK